MTTDVLTELQLALAGYTASGRCAVVIDELDKFTAADWKRLETLENSKDWKLVYHWVNSTNPNNLLIEKMKNYYQAKIIPTLNDKGWKYRELILNGVWLNKVKLTYLGYLIVLHELPRIGPFEIIEELIIVYHCLQKFENINSKQIMESILFLDEKTRKFMLIFLNREDKLLEPECMSLTIKREPYFYFESIFDPKK